MTMETWRWWRTSKYETFCSYCKAPVMKTEGRWSMKRDGQFFTACQRCMAPPEEQDPPQVPPPLHPVKTMQPTIDGAACPQPPEESRESRIERMHDENVQWQKHQYDALMEIKDAVKSLKATMIERNMMLKERAKE